MLLWRPLTSLVCSRLVRGAASLALWSPTGEGYSRMLEEGCAHLERRLRRLEQELAELRQAVRPAESQGEQRGSSATDIRRQIVNCVPELISGSWSLGRMAS